MKKTLTAIAISSIVGTFSTNALANDLPNCEAILGAINSNNKLGPDGTTIGPYASVHTALKVAMGQAISIVQGAEIGLSNHMWATINDRDGIICAVAYSGDDRGDQWPGSRNISAEKAYTTNAYSLNGFALSTAMLYAANLDGGGFYGLQFSNLMNPTVAYDKDNTHLYGEVDDPMVGEILGGHIIFGGGLGLYVGGNTILGGVGASGDTACYDHAFAWIVRDKLGLDETPNNDNLQYNKQRGNPPFLIDGFEHVDCGFGEQAFVEALPTNFPLD